MIAVRFIASVLITAVVVTVAVSCFAVAFTLGWLMIAAGWVIKGLEYLSGEKP